MARRQSTEAIIRLSMDETVSLSAQVIRKEMDDTARTTKKVATGADKVGGSLLSAKESAALLAAGLDAALGLIGTAASAALSLRDNVREAATSIAVESRFTAVADSMGGAASAMERLTAASAGGIDGTSLQKFAIKANSAGVSLQQLEQLLKSANKAAQATGASQTEMTEQFVQGLIDLSDGSFKALGLQVDLGQAVGKTATELGVNADALSVNRKRQILLERALVELGRAFGDLELNDQVVAVNKLDADWSNLTDTLTRGFADATVEAAKFFGVIEGQTRVGNLLDNSTWMDIAGGIGAATIALADLAPWVDIAGEEMVSLSGTMARAESVSRELERALDDEAIAARAEAAATRQAAIAKEEITEAQRSHRELLRETVNELARASQAEIDRALALARTATEMGEGEIAARKYADALKMAEGSGISFAQVEAIKRESVRKTSEALLAQLEVMAEVELGAARNLSGPEADAAFQRATQLFDRTNALRRKLASGGVGDELVSEALRGGGSSNSGGSGGGGGGSASSSSPEMSPLRKQQLIEAEFFYEEIARKAEAGAAAESEARARAAAAAQQANERALREAERIIRLQTAAQETLSTSTDAAARASLQMSQSFSSAFGGAAGAVATASQIIVSQVDQVTAVMAQFREAGLSSSDAFVGAVPGMLAASGQLAAGFIGDQQTQAGVMGAFELAAAIASFAQYDYGAGAMHLLSSGLYFAVAGGAFASGGASAGAAGASSRPPPLPSRVPQTARNPDDRDRDNGGPIHIHMSGATIIGSDEQRAGRDLANLITKATRRQSRRNPDFARA